jgi:hypothetical protein
MKRKFGLTGLLVIAISIFTGNGFSQARKPIKSLKDIEVLAIAEGTWEGVGVGFDLENGELQPPQTFRDDWTSAFKKEGQTYEMTGLIKRGGQEMVYAWVFKFNGGRDKITASYEMATNQTGILGVKVLADGKRVQLHPISGKKGINMTIDIYFEDKDIVIESQVRNLKGELVYQSATRYQKITSK